jgi:Asp-tRNA(Asn)/Glu-tRNA(Gln) amidotransferase B subunit
MGQFMKASGGKVDPKTANQALRNALEQWEYLT